MKKKAFGLLVHVKQLAEEKISAVDRKGQLHNKKSKSADIDDATTHLIPRWAAFIP
jgi:hypothetical protein